MNLKGAGEEERKENSEEGREEGKERGRKGGGRKREMEGGVGRWIKEEGSFLRCYDCTIT